jgi:hypothetical protein
MPKYKIKMNYETIINVDNEVDAWETFSELIDTFQSSGEGDFIEQHTKITEIK